MYSVKDNNIYMMNGYIATSTPIMDPPRHGQPLDIE